MKKFIGALGFVVALAVSLTFISCGDKDVPFPEDEYWAAYETMLSEDYGKAAEEFQGLTKKAQKFPEIWYNYGLCLQELEQYQDAVKALETAAKNSQNAYTYDSFNRDTLRTDCLVQIGEVYIVQGDMEKAESQFQKVLDQDKENQNLQVGILATYLRTGHLEEAFAFCEKNGIDLLGDE